MKPSRISLASSKELLNEPRVEAHAVARLEKAGYDVTLRRCKSPLLRKHWPSKAKDASAPGYPDILLHIPGMDKPICVWENKGPDETALDALKEAEFYVEGLRNALPHEPALPRIAVGYNGKELRASVYTNESKWVYLKIDGDDLKDRFPTVEFLAGGVAANGTFTAANGAATAGDLRALLTKLRTLYRNIATLASGRTPIDFTVALLTLKLIVEQTPDWGTWSEMPRFAPGAQSDDHGIGERLETLVKRVLTDHSLQSKYADIFRFHEKSDTLEIAFSFSDVLATVEKGKGHFVKLHLLLDQLPPLTGADFDIFGEVYQAIGDEATKKKLGEFFTGRHIISGILPILFSRAGYDKAFLTLRSKKIADIACGTGGFLTETLRLVRRLHEPKEEALKAFAKSAFFGYDIGHANASRARVNMYFAGDSFSAIRGGFDTLSETAMGSFPFTKFDLIMTNPPYGSSNYGRIERAFLLRALDLLKPGTGWLLIVLPTGILENPRSAKTRFSLLNEAAITDVISLPKHAFAPYTQQRTAIVIAQKRKKRLVADGAPWSDLIAAAKDEKIGMFIVDNDGYANSDKRYPTDKRRSSGEWLHNDLADWAAGDGTVHRSKVYRALIQGKGPDHPVSEFGAQLGPKFGAFDVEQLTHRERGIALLPDIPLRAELKTIPFEDWKRRVTDVESFAAGSLVTLPLPFADEVSFLMQHGIDFPKSVALPVAMPVKDVFEFAKGDPRLTEAMIYQYLSPDGLPVYGGGSGVPRFRAAEGLTRSDGVRATVFSGPALVIAMDGSSGAVQVVEEKRFFCNHHGAVLTPKVDTKPNEVNSVNLWCAAQIIEPPLRRLASNK